MKILSHNEQDTVDAARSFAGKITAPKIICLHGDVGAGKSVFCRALIRALNDDNDMIVPSPTFTIIQSYDCTIAPIYHYDLYRIDDPEEVFALDWDEAMHDGITMIEWPEKAHAFIPNDATHVSITIEGDTRVIDIADHYM